MTDEGPTDPARVRDRQVVLLAAVVVVVVLGLQLLSTFVPAVGDVLGLAPVLIGALIVVTLVVLARALRPRR
jgi:Ca2+/H+ antiporter